MFCPKCGADAGNAKYCPECGAPLFTDDVSPKGNSKKPKKKRGKAIAIVIVAIVVLFILIAAFGGGNSTTSTSPSPADADNIYSSIDAIQTNGGRCDEISNFITTYMQNLGYELANVSTEWIGYSHYASTYSVEDYQGLALGGYYSISGSLSTGETVTGRVSTYWDEGAEPEVIDLTIESESSETPIVAYDEAKLQQCWTTYNERAESAPETTPEPTPVATPVPDLELLDADSYSDGYLSYVTGHIRNNTNKEYLYVQVSINLYDDAGTQVGSTLANVNNLAPGGTWAFEALITSDLATQYRIVDITGY